MRVKAKVVCLVEVEVDLDVEASAVRDLLQRNAEAAVRAVLADAESNAEGVYDITVRLFEELAIVF